MLARYFIYYTLQVTLETPYFVTVSIIMVDTSCPQQFINIIYLVPVD